MIWLCGRADSVILILLNVNGKDEAMAITSADIKAAYASIRSGRDVSTRYLWYIAGYQGVRKLDEETLAEYRALCRELAGREIKRNPRDYGL